MLKSQCEHMKTRNSVYHEENQYISLIQDILDKGHDEVGRNGKVRAVFGAAMHFSLENDTIPLLTTKKVAWKTCFKELFWFLRGSTDNKELKSAGVHIWDGNSSREYLDSRGLSHYKEDELGPVYGWQWRRFNEPYTGEKQENHGNHPGDQLMYIINHLKDPEKRTSRRLIMSAWNILQMEEMALPPCHILVQFNVFDGNKLSCSMYQRSGDVGLGVPFNIASYCALTHILAKHCNLEAKEFCYYLGNAHIYDDHLDKLKLQIERTPFDFPKINIKNIHDNIEDYCLEDLEIIDYVHHQTIQMDMRK